MKLLLARFFKFLFQFAFLKKYFFFFHKNLFIPYKLFQNVTVVSKNHDDILFELKIDDWIQEHIYFLGEYERAEINFIKSSLHDEDIFIDIGANIGLHTLSTAKHLKNNGQIYAFEPFFKNYKKLLKNVALNSFKNIKVEKMALSSGQSELELFYNEDEKNLGMVSSSEKNYTISETVATDSLDNYAIQHQIKKIKCIKIDVEGEEYNVLKGMENILKAHKPIVMVEILNPITDSNSKKIHELFDKSNYKKFFLDDDGMPTTENRDKERLNYVFISAE